MDQHEKELYMVMIQTHALGLVWQQELSGVRT